MTRPRLLRLVRQWVARLALGDWRITVLEASPTSPTTQAQVTLYHDVREAKLQVRPGGDEAALRNTVVHELLHLVLGDYTQVAEELADALPEGERQRVRRELTKLEERAIVRIVRALLAE